MLWCTISYKLKLTQLGHYELQVNDNQHLVPGLNNRGGLSLWGHMKLVNNAIPLTTIHGFPWPNAPNIKYSTQRVQELTVNRDAKQTIKDIQCWDNSRKIVIFIRRHKNNCCEQEIKYTGANSGGMRSQIEKALTG